MFCQQCGAKIEDTALKCDSCGASVATKGHEAVERAKAASKDALGALMSFVVNPVGNLGSSYRSLGARAGAVAIVFAVIVEFCTVLGLHLFLTRMGIWQTTVKDIFKFIVIGVIPIASLAAVLWMIRSGIGRARESVGDFYIAGAALVPFSLLVLLAGILGPGNMEVVGLLGVFGVCYTTLILFAGLTQISTVTEGAAAFAVPVAVVVMAWLSKVIAVAMLF